MASSHVSSGLTHRKYLLTHTVKRSNQIDRRGCGFVGRKALSAFQALAREIHSLPLVLSCFFPACSIGAWVSAGAGRGVTSNCCRWSKRYTLLSISDP